MLLVAPVFGCNDRGVGSDNDQEESTVSSSSSALTAAAAAPTKTTKGSSGPVSTTPVVPAPPSKPSVWVVMKGQASLAQMAVPRDWKGRGQAVYAGLTATAAASQASIKAFLQTRNAAFKAFWIINTLRVTADQATIEEIGKRSDVARVVPDRSYQIPPLVPSALSISDVEWGLANIHAPEVWDQFGARGDGIVVANIDTGVQFDHPALVRQYRGNNGDGTFDHNYNWFDPANICGIPSTTPCDNVAHGTHTMGTMVGDDLNGNQIGVAPSARWIAAKGCEFNSCTLESLLGAGQWVMAPTDLTGQNPRPDLRPHVVNNSWSGGSGDPFYQATVQAWVAAGIFPAFASGNSGPSCGSAGSPSDYPESYGVGAYDINNFIAFFSSRGPSVLDGGIKPNIAAPGVDVRSSVPGNGYDIFSGTSMATPHVAGSVALIWSAAPTLLGNVDATRALFDLTAVDTSDLSCGGTPENNNVFGQGRLDVLAAISQAPIGPQGTLQGIVTSTAGDPIPRAAVHATGAADRRTVTDPAGAYHLNLPEGAYTVTASAFGFETQTVGDISIVADTTTDQPFSLPPVPSFAVSGFVRDNTGIPVPGAQVSIGGTPLPPAITDGNGRYSFASVPAGDYQVTAQAPGGCYGTASSPLTISADVALDFTLDLRPDGFGYLCRLVASQYIPANEVLSLTGDDSLVSVEMPFAFSYYDSSFSSINVTTNGFVNFVPTFPNFGNVGIPDPFDPNAAIFPFWDDLFVDGSIGTVRTETVGTAPNRQFVIEWRDVSPLGRPDLLIGFEAVLNEDGSILMNYQTAEPDSVQRGASASVGIENETGTIGLQFSLNQATLSSGMSISYVLPPSGAVTGTVTDLNDGRAISGATLQALQNGVVVRQGRTGNDGTYRIRLPVGDYTIQATAPDYSTESANISLANGAVVRQDFALRTGRASITPATIQLTIPVNQVRTRTLTLSNSGSASMTFNIAESGGGRQATVSTVRLARNPSADPNALNTRALFAPGIAAKGMSPMATGDVLKTFPPTGMGFAWGVGQSTNLLFSDVFAPFRDVEFTTDGAATGFEFATPWVSTFGADMAYVAERNLMCQINVGGDNGIYCMDPASGTVMATITGGFPWTGISQRGLAYRSDDDSFYIGGWNEGIVYHINGLSSATPGEVIGTCRPGDGSISGLAYNGAVGVLWAATNSPFDTIYELNPDDCTVLSTLSHPQPGGFQGGGLEMDPEGNLWMISQNPNLVFLVESGVPAFSDVPWLSVTPSSGTVAAGATQALRVTIDTHGLAPGLYLATLFVQTSAAQQRLLRVPVSLFVPDYQQGVNAGGGAYTDTLGDTWAADRRFVAGSWGYVLKSKTATTNKAISGTPDPTLFKSQRIDPYAYRFDAVPNGTYQIELRFAELEKKERIGKRLFDVIVEDTLVLPAHDIVYEVGTFAAESRMFFVDVLDGHMDIRLIPRAGFDPPVINAARITHRNDR